MPFKNTFHGQQICLWVTGWWLGFRHVLLPIRGPLKMLTMQLPHNKQHSGSMLSGSKCKSKIYLIRASNNNVCKVRNLQISCNTCKNTETNWNVFTHKQNFLCCFYAVKPSKWNKEKCGVEHHPRNFFIHMLKTKQLWSLKEFIKEQLVRQQTALEKKKDNIILLQFISPVELCLFCKCGPVSLWLSLKSCTIAHFIN